MEKEISKTPYPTNYFVKEITIYLTHFLLFLFTFFTTTLAGVQWLNKDPLELSNFSAGLPYSICIMCVLASHEFGHYFAAVYHKIKVTLPFFIPAPPFLINPFGTLGAVIRIRSPIYSKKALFDIGIAGPLSGLFCTLFILFFAFFTLPGKEYIFSIHPEYLALKNLPENGFTLGNSILFWILTKCFSPFSFIPPMNEIYHYPYLCVGWFGLFITTLNLIPIGQLDGGHILYSLVGKKQGFIARLFLITLIIIGVLSFFPLLFWHIQPGSLGWLLWAAILFFIIKIDHPPITDDTKLDNKRVVLGWSILIIFIITFPPIPFYEVF